MTYRDSLSDIQRRTYKQRDAWWTAWLVDPLASRLVWLVAPVRWITPNFITLAAFFVGALAAVSFGQGTRGWIALGAVLFHFSFVLDCMDGKIARLHGNGSVFGAWLDYVFDRIRVAMCAVALMGGQYLLTDNFAFVWAAGVVIFLDMFRYLNHLQMQQVWEKMRLHSAHPIAEPQETTSHIGSHVGRFSGLRDALARMRIRSHLFSGIEFQMFVFIIGPLLGQVLFTTAVAAVLLVGFEVLIIMILYRATRKFDQQNAYQSNSENSSSSPST